jgi:hypothetical protein
VQASTLETRIIDGPRVLPKPTVDETDRRRRTPPETAELIAKITGDDGRVFGLPVTVTFKDYWAHPRVSNHYPAMVEFVGTARIGDGRPWKIQGHFDPTAPAGDKGCFIEIPRAQALPVRPS